MTGCSSFINTDIIFLSTGIQTCSTGLLDHIPGKRHCLIGNTNA